MAKKQAFCNRQSVGMIIPWLGNLHFMTEQTHQKMNENDRCTLTNLSSSTVDKGDQDRKPLKTKSMWDILWSELGALGPRLHAGTSSQRTHVQKARGQGQA